MKEVGVVKRNAQAACQKLVPLLPNTQRVENNGAQKICRQKRGRRPGRAKIRGYYTAKQPRVTTRIVNKNPPSYVDQPKPRHLRSCARCRKHKTKCDYVDTVPNPCSSCARRGVTCELEIVIPVKRSSIIKNISDDIEGLKSMVDSLLARDAYLRDMCKDSNITVKGLIDFKDTAAQDCHNCACSTEPCNYPNGILTPPNSVKSVQISKNLEQYPCSIDMVVESSFVERTNSLASTIGEQVTPPSDVEYKFLPEDSPKYEIEGVCSYELLEIEHFICIFNEKLLPRVPIMPMITSVDSLFNNNKLLFWSIIYVVTGNKKIECNFVRGELTRRCWLETPRDLSIIQSIIIMAAFPLKKAEKVKASYEFDTSVFQQLELAKDLSAQIGLGRSVNFMNEFSRSVENKEIQCKYRYNIWCLLYILGTIYGFKLGLKWDFKRDYIIENMRKTNSYVGRLLNVVVLHSEIIDTIAFNYETASANTGNTAHLEKRFAIWRIILQRLKSEETDINILVMLSTIELTLQLFDDGSNVQEKFEQNKRIAELCTDAYNLISVINIATAPIYVKIALEFVSVVLIKLSLSPYNQREVNTKFLGLVFQNLASLSEYTDTRQILELLMDVQSSFIVDDTAILMSNFSSFRVQLLQGLMFDLKNTADLFKSCLGDRKELSVLFSSHGMDENVFKRNTEKFIRNIDLIGPYSDALFNNMPSNESDSSYSYDGTSDLFENDSNCSLMNSSIYNPDRNTIPLDCHYNDLNHSKYPTLLNEMNIA